MTRIKTSSHPKRQKRARRARRCLCAGLSNCGESRREMRRSLARGARGAICARATQPRCVLRTGATSGAPVNSWSIELARRSGHGPYLRLSVAALMVGRDGDGPRRGWAATGMGRAGVISVLSRFAPCGVPWWQLHPPSPFPPGRAALSPPIPLPPSSQPVGAPHLY